MKGKRVLSVSPVHGETGAEGSIFMFENHLQTIKKTVRSGKSPMAQIANRLEESLTRPIEQPKK